MDIKGDVIMKFKFYVALFVGKILMFIINII